ncbi:cytochrome C oxidase subunit IV family protein [Pelagicoccus sp. SDUM812003]|uniref:cytochrome C oxidase subunit IV family protein n=1 Tax=Pelagicoccus sp. SDUM812003 TaxID=3041267 RepID=UPI00280F8EDE|nr:cytochrome C oxidase subunit IV family protein [Pelagicoccus sp. SDUM812003]MDQ8204942.1 cytochrome C oxidase subunit IV family protein [Pelagicoccus sp. SDUM812003]
MAGHNSPSYLKIYIMLLVLFIISVAGPELADILHLEGATRLIVILITAFGIALVKAYYVLAYFMHLKFEKIYAPYILLSMVAIMFVFFFGVATDSMKSEGHNWVKEYQEPEVAAGEGGHHGDDAHQEEDGHQEESHH